MANYPAYGGPGEGASHFGGGGLGTPAAVGPRVVPTTVKRSGGMTLDALIARQKEAAARQQEALQTPQTTIPGGIGQMLTSYLQGRRKYQAEQEEQRGHDVIADVFSKMDPATGATAEQMAAIGEYDPDMMIKLWSDRASRLADAAKQEHWEPIPTPQGENGQWFRNPVSGETKKVGGGSPGEGGWKPADLGTLRDDYTKAATVYQAAAPAWQSMHGYINDTLGKTGPNVGPADLALVISAAKILDPTSVVREGEVETVKKTGGAADYLVGYVNTLRQGGNLSDDVRRGLMNTAQQRMQAYYDQAKASHDWISGIATRNKLNPDDIVPPLPEFQGWTEQAAPEEIPRPDNDADLKVGQTYSDPTGQAATYTGKNPANPDDPVNWKPVHGAPEAGGQ